MGCEYNNDFKLYNTLKYSPNFQDNIKRWGIDNTNIAYRYYPSKKMYTSIKFLENPKVKKMLEDGDIKYEDSDMSDDKLDCYMYDSNSKLEEFKELYKKFLLKMEKEYTAYESHCGFGNTYIEYI